ncbi:MAG TPA: DUF1911 domain-containing protein [Paracoccus sp. (in: a-proteobacteria)]|jgi:hypothetical protein|nr:DUF1911 domain-containing protein [Paracoccus sp. (in: a-proteobacteria)]
MRDKKKSGDFWMNSLTEIHEVLAESEAYTEGNRLSIEDELRERRSIEGYTFDIVSVLYSSGAPMPEVAKAAKTLLIEAYPKFVALCRQDPDYAVGAYGGGWDFRTRYLALAVLARLTPEEGLPLVEAMDFWPERDAVWEHFIAALGHGSDRPPVDTLVWREAYEYLREALDPAGTDLTRLAALKTFDKNWLKEMRSATNPFYSNENNKNNTYVGYWDFEAAAAAVIMSIDDEQLAGSPTYPKDWADWARRG